MSEVVFKQELLIPVYEEAYALCEKHWNETEEQYRNAEYNPDKEALRNYEQFGMSRYFTCRKDGELIGHIYFIIFKHLHTQQLTANEDFFYFLPEHRKGRNAYRLLQYALKVLKEDMGCVQVGMSSKLTGGKPIDKFLERMGFTEVAHFYVI